MAGEAKVRYTIAFALTQALGNRTRYLNLLVSSERRDDIEFVWAPVHTGARPPSRLPAGIIDRLPLPVLVARSRWSELAEIRHRWREIDAIVVHGLGTFCAMWLWRCVRLGGPVLVLNQDGVPMKHVDDFVLGYKPNTRDSWLRRRRFRAEAWFSRRADAIVPFSTWAADLLVRDSGVDPDRVTVVPMGMDRALWPMEPMPARADDEPARLLFVGGAFYRKGGDILVDVARRLQPRVTIDFVTREAPADLPSFCTVHDDISSNDPRLQPLYRDCDIFVLPTRADMSSNVAMEAMSTGRPVIATRTGGVPDIVVDGVTGRLIPVADDDALETAINELLGDADLRARFGQAGRARVEEVFDIDVCLDQLLAAVTEAIETRT